MADEIIDIGKMCRQYGVKDVMFSSIIVKKNIKLGNTISQVNGVLNKKCEENGLNVVSNGNILQKHLCKDGVHLTDEETNICAGNIVDYIKHFILKEFWNEVACNDGHFEDRNTDNDEGNTERSS